MGDHPFNQTKVMTMTYSEMVKLYKGYYTAGNAQLKAIGAPLISIRDRAYHIDEIIIAFNLPRNIATTIYNLLVA